MHGTIRVSCLIYDRNGRHVNLRNGIRFIVGRHLGHKRVTATFLVGDRVVHVIDDFLFGDELLEDERADFFEFGLGAFLLKVVTVLQVEQIEVEIDVDGRIHPLTKQLT